MTRRSPSYESRLSKYSHRGFEVFVPGLDRSRIDPTIYERSFGRTLGLARLLVLERLPKPLDRDQYIEQRRQERGRPSRYVRFQSGMTGDIKATETDEIAEWAAETESGYNTFTVPYGKPYNAKKFDIHPTYDFSFLLTSSELKSSSTPKISY